MLLPPAITQKACLAPAGCRRAENAAIASTGTCFPLEVQASYLQAFMEL